MAALCDFCSAPDPEWLYPCKRYAVAALEEPVGTSAGGWAACAECSLLVDRDDFDALANRAATQCPNLRAAAALLGHDKIAKSARALHEEFRRHRRGARIGFG